MMQHLMNTYGRQAIAFSRGEGSWLWDLQGKRYLDCLCSESRSAASDMRIRA